MRKVDQQTKAGKKANAVSVNILEKVNIDSGIFVASIPKTANTASCISKPRTPIKRPVATNTGIIGTNTSENILIAL